MIPDARTADFIVLYLTHFLCFNPQLHLRILAGTESRQRFRLYPNFLNRHSVFYSCFISVITAPAISWIFPSLLPLLVLHGGDLFFLLLPALHPAPGSRFQKKVQNLFSASTFCIHLSRLFRHASSTYRKPRILKILQSVEAVSIPPVFPPVFRNVFFSVFAGIWCSYRDGTSVYFISIRSYQCRFFHASADGSRASGNERPAQTSGYHFKKSLVPAFFLDVFVVFSF